MIFAPGGSFTGEDFSDIPLPERMEKVRFTDCRFNSQSFIETDLIGTVFDACSLDFTRLGGAAIEKCAFLNCTFRYANLLGASFEGCKMTGSDLSELSNGAFSIVGGDWSFTSLRGLRIKKRDLAGANFSSANLFDCRFEACRLADCRFDNAIVNQLSLKKSDIRGASFDFVNLDAIDFSGCTANLDFAIAYTRAHGIRIE